jgi:phosphatidylserine/phosphatidylglycerophosphate/cardiolipin synthase-like enzyme
MTERPLIIATGLEFVNKGLRATKPVMDSLIKNADDKIHMLVYRFGDPSLLEPIEEKVYRGVKLCIVVDRLFDTGRDGELLQPQEVQDKLLELNKQKHVTLASFREQPRGFLHAKVIVADRREMIVGSANFSKNGMDNSYEIGFHVEGIECQKIADVIEDLSQDTKLVDVVP